ncbi:MAG: sulfurtransferase complex subunit TusB [Gammaproteobacteria bacterium]|nr:sulfurtransferase complex subunit TusB [Gammaproteobacteria bacterium]NIR99108.1 sulfurtransferase complex subunit TusB [Gammaproteobacteria bacterium]NIT64740.1 sulfurtransferase complex subunit TusB [Gammaproteobacteria bacterium]NIV21698.1 sulfurtransferase complex subunit TusB [Gammaproteobacteria bacterium]NIX10569.1 sulfurtransferase complex subunit TusB [Gammaproteobacteria bacterium]
MLHTVNKSPFERNTLASCLKHAKPGSSILLIEDGVYAVSRGTQFSETIEQAMKEITIYALRPDLEARGIQDRVVDGVELVGYDGFVDLVEQNERIQSWL